MRRLVGFLIFGVVAYAIATGPTAPAPAAALNWGRFERPLWGVFTRQRQAAARERSTAPAIPVKANARDRPTFESALPEPRLHRAVLREAQALQAHRSTLRENRAELRHHRHAHTRINHRQISPRLLGGDRSDITSLRYIQLPEDALDRNPVLSLPKSEGQTSFEEQDQLLLTGVSFPQAAPYNVASPEDVAFAVS
jgi:hypothetical protein